MSNRLSHSGSAYLRSAEHQPIEWYEFGEEAFEKARELDRPVLLDIGAVWCHWCHVIDRESYENQEIADLINAHYIAVKVDRDQRPDIDARYQQVIQSMSGQGGWPLTAFLTFDGRVIYGGTYFPPQAMKQLLEKIHTVYREKKDEILDPVGMLTDEMAQKASEPGTPPPTVPMTHSLIEAMIQSMKRAYDPSCGGFGQQPKFPHNSALELLATYVHDHGDAFCRQMLEKTLEEMGRGGIYDQIAGGFHRYSVDRFWHVPHFEKMAYDNAEALKVYSQAYRLTGNAFFKEIADGTLDWVMRDLSDSVHGGFYASQDADINLDDDGDHFTWTLDEVKALFPAEQAEAIGHYYDLTPTGDMHERPGRNVLWVKISVEAIAQQLGQSVEQVKTWLEDAKMQMSAVRARRPIPFIDTTVYVNWNGMMITGFLEAAMWLDRQDAKAFALKTLDRLNGEYWSDADGLSHSTGVAAFLEDYAFFIQANLKAYQMTGVAAYLDTALKATKIVISDFQDELQGGFYDVRQVDGAHGLLKFRRKPVEDSPSSGANAVMIQNLLQLELITGEIFYRDLAEKALQYFVPQNINYGFFIAALGLGLYRYVHPPLKLELVNATPDLIQKAMTVFSPGKIITYTAMSPETEPQARICIGTRCLAPLKPQDDWDAALAQEALPLSGNPA